MKKTLAIVAIVIVVAIGAMVYPKHTIPELPPYPLPADVRDSVAALAGECDVVILGEMHGTREVPAVVLSLLDPLTKLGYRAIALEVPHDERAAFEAWARGASDAVPTFFTQPANDGRGNREVLALVRRAVRPPYEWKLICFDKTEAEMQRKLMELLPKDAKGNNAELVSEMKQEDVIAFSLQRDASMAEHLASDYKQLLPGEKVLVICGNLHARTANHTPTESPLAPLWPSFAAVLKRDNPSWRLRSVNVQAFGGEYFNGGKVNQFTPRSLEKVEARPTPNSDWDWELNIPRATVATFLQTPAN